MRSLSVLRRDFRRRFQSLACRLNPFQRLSPLRTPSSSLPVRWLHFVLILVLLAGCGQSPQPASDFVSIRISADGQSHSLSLPSGSTVTDALQRAGITPSALDRLDQAPDHILEDGMSIHLIRVTEQFVLEEITIPFTTQTVQNEGLPSGQVLIAQAGVTGLLQNTYRLLLEDGVEVSRTLFRQQVIIESMPQIVMKGVQKPIQVREIPGKMVYLSQGKAWLMQTSSDDRRLIIKTGDLDGRIFSLSQDGRWLLFTRSLSGSAGQDLNELWFVDTEHPSSQPVSLGIRNVIHFADWQPGSQFTVAYSTVEPRQERPGWQANNDLFLISFNETGSILTSTTILEPSPGGVYGWWGTDFLWSPDGGSLAYSQTDSVGLVSIQTGEWIELADILPYQTGDGSGWLPELSWSSDSRSLYLTSHGLGRYSDETIREFSISSILLNNVPGMNPVTDEYGNARYPSAPPTMREDVPLVWLQQVDEDNHQGPVYHLFTADRQGSSPQDIFPSEVVQGLELQEVQWCPDVVNCAEPLISLVYQGNIWLINLKTLEFTQLTGDGSVKLIDWK